MQLRGSCVARRTCTRLLGTTLLVVAGLPSVATTQRATSESNKNAITLLAWSRSNITATVERANERFGLTLKKNYDNNVSQLLRRSDQWPFLQHGVPAIWFHTGLHPDYHLVSDRADRINYPKMERIARLVHQTSWDLAQDPGRPMLVRR